MDISVIPLFALADRRLAWIDQRQALLATNVANVDTPGFRARDVAPFDAAIGKATLAPVATDPAHFGGGASTATAAAVTTGSGERGPDGNAVTLDSQMRLLADTDDAHALTTGLYHSWLGMFRTAIGR